MAPTDLEALGHVIGAAESLRVEAHKGAKSIYAVPWSLLNSRGHNNSPGLASSYVSNLNDFPEDCLGLFIAENPKSQKVQLGSTLDYNVLVFQPYLDLVFRWFAGLL